VRLLLEKGVDPDSKDTYGRTPLSSAAGSRHEAVVKLLLDEGVDLDSKDTYRGWTPLSWSDTAIVVGHRYRGPRSMDARR